MSKSSLKSILWKYQDIIKEEVNVKEISLLNKDIKITKTFKPLGSKLSNKFWKDTGKIIQLGKEWKIKELENGQIQIFDNAWNNRTLEKDEYEIAYEWLTWNNIAIDWDLIAKLDLEISPQLQKEWIAREISRFLNQMRKGANYKVDNKVTMFFDTENKELEEIINEFSDFFKHEALIKNIEKKSDPKWDIVALFTYEEATINFALEK